MAGFGNKIYSRIGAIVSETVANNKIFDSIVYGIAKRFSIASSGTMDIVIDPTAFDKNFLVFLPVSFKGIGGRVDIDLYIGTDADDDGTIITHINRNNQSSATSTVVTRLNPTINSTGTKCCEFIIPADGTGASANIGGEVVDSLPFNIDYTKKYLLRLTNQSNTATFYGSFGVDYYEL